MSVKKREIEECSKRNVPYIASIDAERHIIKISRPRCWCWDCPGCAEARKDYWSKRVYTVIDERMKAGEAWHFVTFTSHENCKNYSQTAYILRLNFPKLYKRMLRNWTTLLYIAVPEPHKDERLHVHMLTNAPLRQKWYKDNARSCGFGYQADAVTVATPAKCAFYVVKYLSKSLSNGILHRKRFQRVRASKDFPDIGDDNDFVRLKSEVIGNEEQTRLYIAGHRNNGWIVIASGTGELL